MENGEGSSANRQRRSHNRSVTFWIGIASLCVLGAGWNIPLAGNVFRTSPQPEGNYLDRDGCLRWSDPSDIYSVYFHVDRTCQLELSLRGSLDKGSATIAIDHQERELTRNTMVPLGNGWIHAGAIRVDVPGYVRIDLRGIERTGSDFGRFRELKISSSTDELEVQYVRSNEGNMFYWGRRGPSVHLSYRTPSDHELKYAYTELFVPEGQDPIGSYFMANGFREGYFGMQVNSKSERRILFSVWSPYQTDDPKQIPEDQRVVELGRGPGVRVGQFGNEGSGGQSVLVFPWQAGRTYRFLTEVVPDGVGHTTYTSWFGEVSEPEWQLIASFRRPRTNTYLRSFHSFLESFYPNWGSIERRCYFGNVWVANAAGQWMPCTQASFSVDATGGGKHRLDFEGGIQDGRFFLRNCGFFSSKVRAGDTFELNSSQNIPPQIDFDRLPR